jgi:uncharacterized metal-binding protein YceD (DUF177 family)
MPGRRDYDIAFVGLKPGEHEFHYEIDDKFFADRPEQEFKNCRAHVKLILDKHTSFLLLKFEVGGHVDLLCDRCGNPLTRELWDDFEMAVKMAENPDELNSSDEDPDVFYISRTESHINVADWLYEFINLSIPNQRTCADDDNGESTCNREVLDMLKQMELQAQQTKEENPIWKGLDKFRDS